MIDYPILTALPELKAALADNNRCILVAPPGAGKTTFVPPALLNEPWLDGKKIIMLEPRRIAARRSAEYISEQRGETPGETIGYRIRTESRVSHKTRIEIVTEGILTRMLQSDAELPEVGLVIFDEFHERSIHADTALAFILDVQQNIRPDIKILLMSATPDTEKLSSLLSYPTVVESSGRAYPVETHYLKNTPDKKIETVTAEAVLSALRKEEGDILAFLPGKAEIKRTNELLQGRINFSDVVLHELYGDAPREEQEAALRKSNNKRKIILATSIAETSLTIDGVRIVIDSGLSRVSSFDVRRGMPGLITVPVSKASADQRRGRAGRQSPGICYRLWTKQDELNHPSFTQPEILTADLAPLALELAQWGTPSAEGLLFPDNPPEAHLLQARSVLFMLGAVDRSGKLTPFGKRMSRLPVHPRLSAMILHAIDKGFGSYACLLAVLLEEKDSAYSFRDIDLGQRWHNLHNAPADYKSAAGLKRIFSQAEKLRRLINIPPDNRLKDISEQEFMLGPLLALAYPERVARKRSANQYQLAQGTIVSVPEGSMLLREEFLAVGDVDGASAVAKVYLAAPLRREDIIDLFEDILASEDIVEWKDQAVRGRKRLMLGSVTVTEKEFNPSDSDAADCIIKAIESYGLEFLPWDKESRSIRERSQWYRLYLLSQNNTLLNDWPDLSNENLTSTLKDWLSPFLSGVRKKKDIEALNIKNIISSFFSYSQLNFLDSEVPASLHVPGGSNIWLKYDQGEKPVLAVRLQELFGQTDTPKICSGKVPVLIHLLSPALRPLAITQDLRSFWQNVYPDILKQMRIKYPKHVWPDDPLKALPTNKSKKGNRLN
ncbi:MAG: ATP-dependent helicase HrpB [Bacillota bacterium]